MGVIFFRLIVVLLLIMALAIGGVVGQSDRPADVPDSYSLAAENADFRLYADMSTLAFKVEDRRSGYVWHSGIDTPLDDDRLNRSWTAFAASGISIEVLDERGTNRRVSISGAEHTIKPFEVENGFGAEVLFTAEDIAVGVSVTLEPDGVRVRIPFASIREGIEAGFRLGRVYVYPFLGATRGASTPGYMFIPDGTGSLIEFAESSKADNLIFRRYYGDDLGMLAELPYDPFIANPMPIAYPVYGMAHTEAGAAFVSIVESGAGYGALQIHPAGVITNFNFLHHAFIYSETYFQATNRSGAGVTAVQRQPNPFDAVVLYRFLTGEEANYVGMAHSTREYLLASGGLTDRESGGDGIGLRLEFLGGDRELLSLTGTYIPMTTLPQMRAILDDLNLPNTHAVYYGWQPTGATSVTPTGLAVEPALGSTDDLIALADDLAARGGSLALYADPQSAYVDQAGYSARTDIAMAITNVPLSGYTRFETHFFSHEPLTRRFAELTTNLATRGGIGLAVDTLGWTLYSDHRDQPPFSREAAISAYRDAMGGADVPLGFYRPNDYLWGAASAYYAMPSGDNGYIYTSEAVPFLPIVLSGLMPYYGDALNFSSDRQQDLLRHAEYGIWPNFYVTHQPTADMLDTPSGWIYTSAYAQWGGPIRESVAWLDALLGPVRGQAIVGHAAVGPDAYATTYADGTRIIVNYADAPFTIDGVTIPARDAVRVEG